RSREALFFWNRIAGRGIAKLSDAPPERTGAKQQELTPVGLPGEMLAGPFDWCAPLGRQIEDLPSFEEVRQAPAVRTPAHGMQAEDLLLGGKSRGARDHGPELKPRRVAQTGHQSLAGGLPGHGIGGAEVGPPVPLARLLRGRHVENADLLLRPSN